MAPKWEVYYIFSYSTEQPGFPIGRNLLASSRVGFGHVDGMENKGIEDITWMNWWTTTAKLGSTEGRQEADEQVGGPCEEQM